jgi:SPRY domain
MKNSATKGDQIQFKFKGTKLRILLDFYVDGDTNIGVTIDGVTETFSQKTATGEVFIALGYEKLGLADKIHTVVIECSGNGLIRFDAMDIDETGELLKIVGTQLKAPELGWKRYDDTNPVFSYKGNWNQTLATDYYATYAKFTTDTISTVSFKFYGDKIRLISYINPDQSDKVSITIDGAKHYFSNKDISLKMAVVFEKTGLGQELHEVYIVNESSGNFTFDAIDIGENGRLLHPNEVTHVRELEVGKRIRFNFTAPATGITGIVRNIGKETSDFIPVISSANSFGDAYFIMTDVDRNGRKVLVCDRNIQSSISWDELNSRGLASSSGLPYRPDRFRFDISSNKKNCLSIADDTVYLSGIPSYMRTSKGISSGKWYWEIKYLSSGTNAILIGINNAASTKRTYYSHNGTKNSGASSPYGPSYAPGDVIGIFLDLDKGELAYSKNGVHIGVAFTDIKQLGEVFPYIECGTVNGVLVAHPNFGYDGLTYQIPDGYSPLSDLYPDKVECQYHMRLLTGGVSPDDKDNEWDKYIVNSTLDGTISAGDNSVWNWKDVASYTSTTGNNGAGNRVHRGWSSVAYWNAEASSKVMNTQGFRPVLIVDLRPMFSGKVNEKITVEDNFLLGTVYNDGKEKMKYRVEVNGVPAYPITGGDTPFLDSPIDVKVPLNNKLFRVGVNGIDIILTSQAGNQSMQSFKVYKDVAFRYLLKDGHEYKVFDKKSGTWNVVGTYADEITFMQMGMTNLDEITDKVSSINPVSGEGSVLGSGKLFKVSVNKDGKTVTGIVAR